MEYKLNIQHGSVPSWEDSKAACVGCSDVGQDDGMSSTDQNGLPALKPNVAIIIIGLGFTLILVAAFAVFAKFMRPHFSRQDGSRSGRFWDDVVKDGQCLDTNIIKSLPLVVYFTESFRGLNLDSECAVCLSQFEEKEELRLLPNCKHMFHPLCIDSWLRSHPSCPLCRTTIIASSWTLRNPPESSTVLDIPAILSREAQHQGPREDGSSPSSSHLHHHHVAAVEITSVESSQARFQALRDSCYGKKLGSCRDPAAVLPEPTTPQDSIINTSELQTTSVVLPIVESPARRGPIGSHGELCDLRGDGVVVCIEELDEEEQVGEAADAERTEEASLSISQQHLTFEAKSDDGNAHGKAESVASAWTTWCATSENTSHDRWQGS